MADIHAQKKEEVETWTEDAVFDFMTEHFSEEVASKFKGKPSRSHVLHPAFYLRKGKVHVQDLSLFFTFQAYGIKYFLYFTYLG